MSPAIGVLALLLAAETPAALPCNHTRLVAVGTGCLELPCEYRAIMSRPGIDDIGEHFDSTRTQTKIFWYEYDAGFWFFLHGSDEIVWRRPAIHGWHLWWHELVEQPGHRMYVVTNGNFSLLLDDADPNGLSDLAELASSYRVKPTAAQCENPEPWNP